VSFVGVFCIVCAKPKVSIVRRIDALTRSRSPHFDSAVAKRPEQGCGSPRPQLQQWGLGERGGHSHCTYPYGYESIAGTELIMASLAHMIESNGARRGFWARVLTSAAGAWLLLSAFVWHHERATFTNTWVVGGALFLCGLWSFRDSFARWVAAAFAVWLVSVSWLTWQVHPLTTWHNVAFGLLVFGLSFIKDGRAAVVEHNPR
jgi:hypothetical protein